MSRRRSSENTLTIIVIAGVICGVIMAIGLIPNSPRIVWTLPSEAEAEQTRTVVRKETPVRRSLGFFEVTAYCPCVKCCGEYADGVTASGELAVNKFVAADEIISFYKVLDVPEYGVVPVLDRGGMIRGKKLDVFFPTHDEALKWGRRVIEIFCWVEE